MRKQTWKKILLVLLLGAVFLPAGNVWATSFTIKDMDPGTTFSVNVEVSAQNSGTWNNAYGVAVGAGEWIYTYQLLNTSPLVGSTHKLVFMFGIQALLPTIKAGSIDLGSGFASPVIPPTIDNNFPASVLWNFVNDKIAYNQYSDLLYIISTINPEIAATYANGSAAVTDGVTMYQQIPAPGIFYGIEAPSINPNPVPEPMTLLLIGTGLLMGAGGRVIRRRRKN